MHVNVATLRTDVSAPTVRSVLEHTAPLRLSLGFWIGGEVIHLNNLLLPVPLRPGCRAPLHHPHQSASPHYCIRRSKLERTLGKETQGGKLFRSKGTLDEPG